MQRCGMLRDFTNRRDASLCPGRYSEAILLFKLPQDIAWHASALEGMATIPVLDAWAAGNGLVCHF